VRVRLVGATPLHRHLRRLSQAAVEQMDLWVDRCRVRLDSVGIDTRPPVDLEQLAGGRSVAAELARLLLELESPAGAVGAIGSLLSQAQAMSEEISLSRAYQPLSGDPLFPAPASVDSDDCVRSALRRNGMLLLDELLAKKDPRSSGEAAAEVLAP
jgi:hypothetical protein